MSEEETPELDHLVCPRHEDQALCGLDVTGMRWGVDGNPCEACDRAMFCPQCDPQYASP